MIEIQKQLSEWRKERNIKLFPETIKDDLLKELEEVKEALKNLDFNNYVEELADIAIFAFNGLGTMNITHKSTRMSIKPSLNSLESYINNIRLEIPVQTVNILNIIITMCEELVTAKKYDFEKVVLEKIRLLNSRRQSMKQKEKWKKYGANSKWEKDPFQDKDTLYKMNFSYCKIN
jgi:hypothetical protein